MRESVAIAVFVRADSTHRVAVGSTMRRAWTVNLAAQTSIDRDAEGRIRESAYLVRSIQHTVVRRESIYRRRVTEHQHTTCPTARYALRVAMGNTLADAKGMRQAYVYHAERRVRMMMSGCRHLVTVAVHLIHPNVNCAV